MGEKITIVLDGSPPNVGLNNNTLGAPIIAMRRGDALKELNCYEDSIEELKGALYGFINHPLQCTHSIGLHKETQDALAILLKLDGLYK